MKRFLAILVCTALVLGLLPATTLAAAAPDVCQACGTSQKWEVMPDPIPTAEGHYHYYLTGAVTPAQLLVKSGVTVCLDLNGYGIDVPGRAMIAYNGSTVNIMDSSSEGTGYMSGSDSKANNVSGGTITVQENATLNLYSGTLKFTGTADKSAVNNGGVVYLKHNDADKTKQAKMNMYGGRVEGGVLNDDSTIGGAAIYANSNAILNVYGGTITAGTMPATAVGKCVSLAKTSAKMTLRGDAVVEEIYTVAAENVTIAEEYTGKARLLLKQTPAAGLAVGVSHNATITGDLFCTNGNGWLVEVKDNQLVLAAFTPTAERHFCQHCQEVVKWKKLTSDDCTNVLKTTVGEYHYRLDGNLNLTKQISLVSQAQLCLDLYGSDLTVEQRALYVNEKAQLRIMDTKGGGEVIGTTGTNNPTGGVMVIKTNAVVDLYSGTLRLNDIYKAGYGVGVGGVVYMNDNGTLNVRGGTIQGAKLVMSEYKLSVNGKGAAIYMSNSAKLNVLGGQITAGTLAEGCLGECVYVNSKNAQVTLAGSGSVANIYYAYENDQLTVSGTYTGTVNLTYPGTVALTENMVVGKADSADLTAASTGCGSQWMLGVSGNDLVLLPNAPAITVSGGSYTTYTSLQDAIDNAADGYVKLLKPIAENVTVSKDLVLDLNGKTITGTVTLQSGVTLYGMDSQTDDYTVNDLAGYGKLTVTGEGQVLGLPEESDVAEHGYMKITEADGVSFHAVNLKLTAMTLRSESTGVYYKSVFGGDELVAARVKKYGVALSVVDVPTAANLEQECKFSEIELKFAAGGMDADATSTLLKNVMKPTNSNLDNNRNANIPVYGRAYILTEEGYMFGAAAQRSFKEQVEAVDDNWTSLTSEQKAAVVAMYDVYRDVMENWNIPNVIAQKDPGSDGVLKILGIGNSYTNDSMWMLYNIYKAENPDKDIVLAIAYHSGCSLSQHVNYITNSSLEYDFHKINDDIYAQKGTWKTVNDVTLKTIVENENWDIVTMQQASTYSGVADTYNGDIDTIQQFVERTLGYTPTFAWNMTWAYPTKDIEGDAFVTVNTSTGFAKYNNDQMTMYNAIVNAVKTKIVPNKTFTYLMPNGVAVQNANTSYMDDPDLYRDYTHLNDFSRVMAAYVWYCTFENVRVDSLKFTVVPAALTKSYKTAGGTGDMVLTQLQIDIIEESVKNALDARDAGTFVVTQSQYTVKQ